MKDWTEKSPPLKRYYKNFQTRVKVTVLFNNKAERTVLHPPPPENISSCFSNISLHTHIVFSHTYVAYPYWIFSHLLCLPLLFFYHTYFAYHYWFFSHLLCLPILFFLTLTLPTHIGFSHTYLSISYLVLFLAFLFSDIMDYFPYIFNLFNQTLMLEKLPIQYLSLANIILALVCITNGFRFR